MDSVFNWNDFGLVLAWAAVLSMVVSLAVMAMCGLLFETAISEEDHEICQLLLERRDALDSGVCDRGDDRVLRGAPRIDEEA